MSRLASVATLLSSRNALLSGLGLRPSDVAQFAFALYEDSLTRPISASGSY
jgi:hypothetical protein